MIESLRVVVLVVVAAGCNSEEAPPAAESGGGCNVDYARLAGHRKVAFRADVVPVLRRSCGLSSSCHDLDSPEAGLALGSPCPDPRNCPPLGEPAINSIHTNLLMASLTAPAVQRVAPTRPAESFLLDKAADIQNKKGYSCTPQSPSVEGCGTGMPPSGPEVVLCTRRDGQEEFDILAAWVLQGAPND